MPEPNGNTPDPSSDLSVSDLGAMLGGGQSATAPTPAAPAPVVADPVVPAPVVPPLAPPEPTEAVTETPVVEPEKKIETVETVDPNLEPVKPTGEKSGIDKRLGKLSQQRREALASLASEKSRTEGLQRELEALRTAQPGPAAKPAAVAPSGPAKPQLATYVAALKDGEGYEVAVERYSEASADFRETARDAKRQAETLADSAKTQQAIFDQDRAAARETHPDFDEIVERVVASTPAGLQQAITQIQDNDGKPIWPAITMYLDENPAELAALSAQFKTNPYGAAAKLGRIAATLSPKTTAPTLTAPIPAVKKISPKPPVAVGGSAAPGLVDLDSKDTSMDVFGREMTKLGF